MLRILVFLALCSLSQAVHIEDDARVLARSTREKLTHMAQDLAAESSIHFLMRTEEVASLSDFDEDALHAFARFVQGVEGARGVMLFVQLERGSRKGRINFSMGSGLQGALKREDVRRILDQKVLSFRQDLKKQDELIEGIEEYIRLFREWARSNPPRAMLPPPDAQGSPASPARFLQSWPWIIGILLLSLVVSLVLFVFARRKCPRCGSRLSISIKPLSHAEGQYRRIKIIKCFDCSYFRKYLF